MKRIKVINEPSDLVPILRGLDTEVRHSIFMELIDGWRTIDEITEKYGEEGVDAMAYFEKVRLVETTWQPPQDKG
ncbi:MAG: ArsR family transcriptional regulator, partial [Thermoplasmata archaeon]|nr:ArsR family transcriptional regulator [Thermoplasmata archaeon]